MCDEHVDFWRVTEHTARTWKPCYECGGLIAPGDRYVRLLVIDDGSPTVFSDHVACDEIARVTSDVDGCRMLYERAEYFLREMGYGEAEERSIRATLAWMRTRTRARFARALGEALGMPDVVG